MQSDTRKAPERPMPRFSWRLTYAYDRNGIRLVRAERIQMIAPPPVGPAPMPGHSGHWIEVRDQEGALIYHRVLGDLIARDREAFTDEPGRTMHRVQRKAVAGEFQVLIPDIPGADHLVIYGHPPDDKRAGPAEVLARGTFKEFQRLHGPDNKENGEKQP